MNSMMLQVLTHDPDHPNNWVQAYIKEQEEMLSWWQEFGSPYHKGTGYLSNPQVKELERKQMAAFRLPAVQKEKNSWWSALASLTGLRWGDFLTESPTRIQALGMFE